ncbi:hypothetical protein R3I93_022920 [Phoxinus phoxinus]|uniref:Uncharacterized protein n=1 Tax=Phoxinus phoxinus TaxID=58324 RepID=A0AAN9C5P3_9TELE
METPHIRQSLKRPQLQKERMAIIERDNHHLASKLPAIARFKGLVDARNNCPQLSVNTLKKKEKIVELTKENQRINQRIMSQKSDYRKELWEADWEKVKQRRESIARYPREETNKQLQKEDNHHLASKLPAIARFKGLVDSRNNCPQLSVNTLKKEKLVELTKENQRIYQRIMSQKSDYRKELWEADWEKVKQRRESIARYPREETNKQMMSVNAAGRKQKTGSGRSEMKHRE